LRQKQEQQHPTIRTTTTTTLLMMTMIASLKMKDIGSGNNQPESALLLLESNRGTLKNHTTLVPCSKTTPIATSSGIPTASSFMTWQCL
jgi:hypothetical protein